MYINPDYIDDKVADEMPQIIADKMLENNPDWVEWIDQNDEGMTHLVNIANKAQCLRPVSQEDLNKVANYFITLYSTFVISNIDHEAIRQKIVDGSPKHLFKLDHED